MYAAERKSELSENSVKAIWTRVGNFVEWCDGNEIDSLSEIRGIHIHRYKVDMQESVSRSTVSNRLYAVRRFLKWATNVDAVDPELPDKITVTDHDDARERALGPEAAEQVLSHLRKFKYATRHHVTLELLWHGGMRLGALRGIDVDNYHPNPDDADGPFIELRHRPESDTPLKNGTNGERPVGLSDTVRTILDDYIEHERHDVTDQYGRTPLLTSSRKGRVSKSALRRSVYAFTRPCVYSKGCPADRDSTECDAAANTDVAYRCPANVSPHDIRRGSITYMLKNDMPRELVSDRCDVGSDVLEKHYNVMTDIEKMEQRRGYLSNL